MHYHPLVRLMIRQYPCDEVPLKSINCWKIHIMVDFSEFPYSKHGLAVDFVFSLV